MADDEIVIKVRAEDQASATFDKAKASANELKDAAQGIGLTIGVKELAEGIGGVSRAFGEATDAAREAARIDAQLEQVIESTGGAAGVSADQARDLAQSLSELTNFEDDAIVGGENLLLTFTNIGKDVFPQATETMLDMSQALGQDMKSSAIQLGKALNDPIQGVTALRRVGVSFTEAQLEQIKTMQKSGDIMGAQKLILAELSKEFGGSAQAAVEADGGMQQFQNRIGNLKEELGMKLLPVMSEGIDQFEKMPQSVQLASVALLQLGAPLGQAAVGIATIVKSAPEMVAGIKAMTAASAGWLAVLGPIGIALGAAYVANELWGGGVAEWQDELDAAVTTTEKLAIAHRELADRSGIEADILKHQINELEELQEKEFYAAEDAANLAQQEYELAMAAEEARRQFSDTSGIEEQILSFEELNDLFEKVKETSSSAWDAVYRWNELPTEEVELLNIQLREAERQTRALETAQRDGKPVTDEAIEAAKNHEQAIRDEITQLKDSKQAMVDKAVEAGILSDRVNGLTEAEVAAQIAAQLATERVVLQESALIDLYNTIGTLTPALRELFDLMNATNPNAGANLEDLMYNMGYNAEGTDYWRGGRTWVGEEGPEIVDLPRGSRVYSNDESMAMAGGGIIVNIYNPTIYARDEEDVRRAGGDIGYSIQLAASTRGVPL